jgi:hypothetical protein
MCHQSHNRTVHDFETNFVITPILVRSACFTMVRKLSDAMAAQFADQRKMRESVVVRLSVGYPAAGHDDARITRSARPPLAASLPDVTPAAPRRAGLCCSCRIKPTIHAVHQAVRFEFASDCPAATQCSTRTS